MVKFLFRHKPVVWLVIALRLTSVVFMIMPLSPICVCRCGWSLEGAAWLRL